MHSNTRTISNTHNIPFLHVPYKGTQETSEDLHFFHANGFPAGVYEPILNELSQHFNIYAMNNRAMWPDSGDANNKNWQPFADDLIHFIEHNLKHPIIAVGHSMGASTTVMAAIKRPDLFKAVVLIEPAMVNWPIKLLLKLTPKHFIYKSKLVQGTLNKVDRWAKKEDYESYIKRFKGYKRFDENAYTAFKNHAIQKTDQGDFTLVHSNQWEAHNYTNPPFLMRKLAKLSQLNIATVAVRGAPNLFITQKLWKLWKIHQPNAAFLQDKKYAHLMPLEGPKDTTALILKGLDSLLQK